MTKKLATAVVFTALAVAGCGGSQQHPQTGTFAAVNDPATASTSAPGTVGTSPRRRTTTSRATTKTRRTITTIAHRAVRHHPSKRLVPHRVTTTPTQAATTSSARQPTTTKSSHTTSTAKTTASPPTRTTTKHTATKRRPPKHTATKRRPPRHKATKRRPTKSKTVLPGTMTTSATTTNAGMPSGTDVQGPTPIECMQQRQLINPHAIQLEEWEGRDPLSKKPIFVVGPFQTPALAQQYVQTYNGINLDAAGGLYVASAALTSNLDFQVSALAKCLTTAIGTGTLS